MNVPPVRIIARIDIKGPNVIKGIHLEGLKVVGQPGAMVRKYYEQGADEIIYMDVVASLYGRNSILSVVEEAAAELFVPMTVGGAIRSVEDIVAALRSGADKVAINTAALQRPDFLTEAAEAFGRQCVVLSVEAKRRDAGKWEALTDNGREQTGVDVLDWVAEAEARGIGEILVTSVDMEGTEKGFDIELVKAVRDRVSVPIIACGGAGEGAHVQMLLEESRCDAVCCASLFHYDRLPLPALKSELATAGWEVRQ
ncbi:MAG: imidazole glycerol phosphate synthase subunit HisF [Rhodospirillaceae bacterium]|nr:imidazole glycerol phosphate synthase subunit HisF [Rhodospirillaceae bacterium]|tara:strand:- start:2001 stop:2765 length:765 start_codon:yes stop_codon:yes gene_type:complete